MKFTNTDRLKLGRSLMGIKFLKRRAPLLVGWALTNRCDLHCLYCDARNLDAFEIPTIDVYKIVDELHEMGTRFIQFTGGDPILRSDIGEILRYCSQKGIHTTLSCSGMLVPEKIDELATLGRLGLSLDGSRKVHDFLRGEGTFETVMKAAGSLVKNNVKFKFVTVLTNYNLKELEFLLDLAEKLDSAVIFQPGILKKLYGEEDNETAASAESYRETVMKIIEQKKHGARVANSLSGLKHLMCWPASKKQICPGGRIMCCIRNNGQVAVCSRIDDSKFPENNCLKKGVSKAFYDLPAYECDNCWASLHVESSWIMRLNAEAILNSTKLL